MPQKTQKKANFPVGRYILPLRFWLGLSERGKNLRVEFRKDDGQRTRAYGTVQFAEGSAYLGINILDTPGFRTYIVRMPKRKSKERDDGKPYGPDSLQEAI